MQKLHFPGLNGLRAIAAGGVLVQHLNADLADRGKLFSYTMFDLAGYGVTLFFVLSGFLITYLLLLEKEKTGTVAVKKFYIRRILRIWPLYYLYLITAVATIYFFARPDWQPWVLPLYFLILPNVAMVIGNNPSNLIIHYWSLGVEEQFYLFWPVFVKLTKNTFMALVIFTGCLIFLKILLILLSTKYDLGTVRSFMYYSRVQCMSLGGIAAVLLQKKNKIFFKICTSYISQFASWLSMVLIIFNKFNVGSTFNNEIFSLLAIILIVNVSSNPSSLLKLNNGIWNNLGKISFGIYVIHPICIFLSGLYIYKTGLTSNFKIISMYSLVLISTLSIAWLSYTFFESKFINLKKRFTIIESRA